METVLDRIYMEIPQQFHNKKNIEVIFKSYSRQIKELFKVFDDLDNKTTLENGIGTNLDYVGSIVNLDRKEAGMLAGIDYEDPVLSDERYRQFLKYKILKNTSECTYYDIINGLQYCFEEEFRYKEESNHPATIILELKKMLVDEVDNRIFFKHLCIRPSGVNVFFRKKYYGEYNAVSVNNDLIDIIFKSSFYPRDNIQIFYLDGSFLLNGEKYLDGFGCVDLYPSSLTVSSNSEINVNCEAVLTIEKDLWFLDGSTYLDGNRLLDAETLIYDDL